MSMDTDTQSSSRSGVREFDSKYGLYLRTQIGNPEGDNRNQQCTTTLAHAFELQKTAHYCGDDDVVSELFERLGYQSFKAGIFDDFANVRAVRY